MTTKICRLIDKNISFYGEDCKIKKKYADVVFAHAYANREDLSIGMCVTPFEPEKYQLIMQQALADAAEMEEINDYINIGIRKNRNETYEKVKQYFDDLIVPKESRSLVKIIRSGVLAAIVTDDWT